MFTCFIHSWYSLTDQCPQCSRTGGSSDSTELIINPTPEGVSADSLSDGEKQYAKGLAQNLGKVQPYHYSGPRCVPGCKNFAAYETKHHKDCPYYSGSLSEKQDEEIARLKEGLDAAREDEAKKWEAALKAERERAGKLMEALGLAKQYFDDRADCDYQGDPLEPIPNYEMIMLSEIQTAINEYNNTRS